MAAAKARTARQRTANCFFVQDDNGNTPNFSGCPSSSSSNFESDFALRNPKNRPDHSNPVHTPLNHSSDLKWWLHVQPNCGNQKDVRYEQLNCLEAELEDWNAGSVNSSEKVSQGQRPIYKRNSCTDYTDQSWKVSATSMKNDQDMGLQELNALVNGEIQKPGKKDTEEFWYGDDHLMELEFNYLVSEQTKKLSSSFDSPWVGSEKTEPWWRTAGKDELASLVAQKSREHIENCDLPQPLTKNFRKGSTACQKGVNHCEILHSSLERRAEVGLSSLANSTEGSPNTVCVRGSPCLVGEESFSTHDSDRPFSNNDTDKDEAETQNLSESDPSKAQLLEALCHSQTRAREAENAAQQARTEREHILTLFFRQASVLFAYRQWVQLLQLENFCLQSKNKNRPIPTIVPTVLPWASYKHKQTKKGENKAGKRKCSASRHVIRKCAVAFAMGLSLGGAGLLLGWAMAWLFPNPRL